MPLSYAPPAGDLVWIRRKRWRVEALRIAGDVSVLDVSGPDGERTFLTPFDRPWVDRGAERTRRVTWRHARATLLALAARRHTLRLPMAVLDAKVDLLPFQLEATLALLAGTRRVLVADDVGLGKTVQAGLAIAETIRRASNAMVLVLAPGAVRDQWIGELRERFAIEARPADATTLRLLASETRRHGSPWRPGVWIATPDFIKQPHVLAAVPLVPWDLLVIDEAHDVAGASDRHAACDTLARRARRVLLLTATPHSGDAVSFARLCSLGELDATLAPGDDFSVLRRTPATLGWPTSRRTRWRRIRLTAPETDAIDALLEFERHVLREAGQQRPTALLLLSVLRKRALSTMASLAESIRRRATWLEARDTGEPQDGFQHRLPFDDVPSDDFQESEEAALSAEIGLGRARERAWLRRLQALADRAAADDSRIRAIVSSVLRAREPAVVFTEFRHSLEAIGRRLGTVASVAAIHGGMAAHDRRAELERFLGSGADVLLATDVAGQGLNLQSRGRWVINVEVPWNPARLAQRAGRVDRLGQRRPVHVTILTSTHRAESALVAHVGARAARAWVAAGVDLGGVRWPSDREVGAALVGGSTVPEAAAPPSMQPDATWQRHARWLTRQFLARRQGAQRWQGGGAEPGRTLLARRRIGRQTARDGWLVVFSASIVDESGVVVETHMAAYRVASATRAAPDRPVIERARADVVRRLERRCARVALLLDSRRRAAASVELRIERELRVARAALRPQPGLFDASRGDLDSISRPVTEPPRPARVAVGRVVLVCVASHARP